jgi:hypothetical protein
MRSGFIFGLMVLSCLPLFSPVKANALSGIFFSYELKKHLLKFFGCELSQVDLRIRDLKRQTEREVVFDGDLQARGLEYPADFNSLAKGVKFDVSLSVARLHLKEIDNKRIPYDLIYDPSTRFLGTLNISADSIHQAIANVMAKDSRIRSFQLEIEKDKLCFQARAGNRFGGVRIELELGFILHSVNSADEGGEIELVILKEVIKGWGLGKMKVKEAKAKVKELVRQASVSLPLDEIYKGFVIRELSLNKDGLEMKIENRVSWKESLAALRWVRDYLETQGG